MTIERDWLDDAPEVKPSVHREHRVVGPPGCGKTHYVGRQVEVAAQRYAKSGIAVVSLTKAAAAEATSRVALDPQQVGTLHSFAYRALDRPQIAETAKGIRDWNDWVGVGSMRLGGQYSADPENAEAEQIVVEDDGGGRLLAEMSLQRQRMRDRALWHPDVQYFAQEWDRFKAEKGYLDFTDLIEHALHRIEQMPGNPWVIFADEAQDMSTLEMALLRKWGAYAEQLVLVGDPDQALYTWRGADPDGVFGDDPERVIVLEQGYRVPAAVLEVANDWISRMDGRLPIRYLPRRDDDGRVVAGQAIDSGVHLSDAGALLEPIQADLANGKTVMVLASCGYMLNPLIATLRAHGLPFHNPYRVKHGGWNPLAHASRLLAYLRPDKATWGDLARMWTWDDLRRWTDPLHAKGTLTHGSKALIKAKCTADRFGESQAEQQLGVGTLIELLDETAREPVMLLDLDWWEQHLRHTEARSQAFALAVARTHGGQALRATPRLIVGTIHSVKGGQADVVYLAPDLSTAGYWEGYRLAPELEQHKSVQRMIYVGMTRAREKLVMLAPSTRQKVDW